MRRLGLAFLIIASLWGRPAKAGEVASTLGDYASAGAGIGALLGTAAATIPYLQSKQPYDFFTGAGVGLLSGSVVGLILGMVDVATPPADQATGFLPVQGLNVAFSPQAAQVTWTQSF